MKQNELIDSSELGRQRACRLRRLRNLANLSRRKLCEGADINLNTYIGYEVGRYGGLTENGAEKAVRYLVTQGVRTSYDWLMHNLGASPTVVPVEHHPAITDPAHPSRSNSKQEMQHIAEEVHLFYRHYQCAIDLRIDDDGMLPQYEIGDHVAGVFYAGSLINDLIGLDCIVKTSDGQVLVRHLCEGRSKDHYTLVCTNPKTTFTYPVMHDVKLISAAQVIWHRRVSIVLKREKSKKRR